MDKFRFPELFIVVNKMKYGFEMNFIKVWLLNMNFLKIYCLNSKIQQEYRQYLVYCP